MANKAPKGAGSKLGRTETVSIRLDPRLNYLCELAARSQRRTKSSFIESMLDEHIRALEINKWAGTSGHDKPKTFGDVAEKLWHVHESQRLVSLAFISPELMTFEEQSIWTLITGSGLFWVGQWEEGKLLYKVDPRKIVPERVDQFWDQLLRIAAGDSAAAPLPLVTRDTAILEPDPRRVINI